jgi:hypothetical protein
MTALLDAPAVPTFHRTVRVTRTTGLSSEGLASARPAFDGSWEECFRRLQKLRDLQDDWDGQGAEAPPADVLDGAVRLAQAVRRHGSPPPCRVVAGVNGTVVLEWQFGAIYSEMEFIGPDKVDLTVLVPGQPPHHVSFRLE